MRGAPPVQIACGSDRRWQRGLAGLQALAASTVAGWFALHAGWPAWLTATGTLSAAILSWAAACRWAAPPTQRALIWDGQRWTLNGMQGTVEVMLDLEGWLMLRFRGPARSNVEWLPLTLRDQAPQEGPIRVALHAHARLPPPEVADFHLKDRRG
jgi:hypothetical protein